MPIGLYDTKERKIILEPSVGGAIEFDEDEILIYTLGGEYGEGDFRQYYINSRGEIKYPWLYNKDFAIVERPNKLGIAVVAKSKFFELKGEPRSYFSANGKKYERVYYYGIYSSKEKSIVPLEYEKVISLSDIYFACYKNGTFTVVKAEENNDY